MAIHSFLKAERGDPDWQFTPERYLGKEFQMIDASTVELKSKRKDLMVLRQSPTDKKLLAKNLKVTVKEKAELDLIILNEADNKSQQIFLYDIRVCQGSVINLGIFAKDGKLNKHIIQVYLEDEAQFNVYGLLLNDVGGDTEIITKIVHQNQETTSNQLFLSLAGENSQTVFQGMVVLQPGSEGSESNITSSSLVMGQNGKCFTKPEIYNDCEHTISNSSSSSNTLSAEKIYYLQTRGLSPEKAREVVVNSFKNQAINLVQYKDLKEEILQMYAD
jgi:Fe-S cluster assembly scaffold protein SufB